MYQSSSQYRESTKVLKLNEEEDRNYDSTPTLYIKRHSTSFPLILIISYGYQQYMILQIMSSLLARGRLPCHHTEQSYSALG